MKTMCILACVWIGCGWMAQADTVTLTADDTTGQTSFNAAGHWSDSAAPQAGNAYVVDAKVLRTPASASAALTFAGDSLTLQNNATLWIMNAPEASRVNIPDLTVHGAIVRPGSGTVYFGGAITLLGTDVAPSRFCGGNNAQNLYQVATLAGDGVVLVNRCDDGTADFTLRMRGDNPLFAGRVIVDGTGGSSIRLGLGHLNNLGGDRGFSEAIVTLANNGNLFSDACDFNFTNPTWWIDVQNNGRLSGSGSGPRTLRISSPIRGTGTLTTTDNGIVFLDGPIEGITRIGYSGAGTLRLGTGFAFDGPVAANTLRLHEPAVVSNTLSVATGTIAFTVPVSGVAPTLTPLGGLSLGSGKTLTLTVNTSAYTIGTESLALLKGSGLAAQFPLSEIAFSVTDSDANVNEYALAYESEDSMDVLVLQNLSGRPVYLIGNDSDPGSFNTGTHWDNGLPPGPGTNYVVKGGRLLRCRTANAVFAGDSLTVISAGDFAINAGPAYVGNLRLGSGGILTTRMQGEMVLQGTNTVLSTIAAPFMFQIENTGGKHSESRALKVESVFTGTGDVRFQNYTSTSQPGGRYTLTAPSPAFTGGVTVWGDGIYLCISDQLQLGGAAESFRADRLVIQGSAVLRFLNSMTLDEPSRGITLTGNAYLQLTNASQTVVIANPITGGTLVKGGYLGSTTVSDPGTLALDAANTHTKTILRDGVLEVRHAQALGTGTLEFHDNCALRIAVESGIQFQHLAPLVQAGTGPLTILPYNMPEGGAEWPATFESNLFILPTGGEIAPSLFTLPLPASHTVKYGTRQIAEGTQVYVEAKRAGLIFMLK